MLQVGLCRQNADATVNVPREPLRFHGLVVLYSFRHESRHKKKSPRPHVGAKCGMCRASSESYCCCTQTNKGPNTLRALKNQNHKTHEEHKHRDRETHANRRTNKESAQNNLNRQRKRRRKQPIHMLPPTPVSRGGVGFVWGGSDPPPQLPN